MKKLVYLYQRFSSGNQVGNSSLLRQGKAQKEWLEKNKDKYEQAEASSYVDEAKAAYRGENFDDGALGKLLEAVESGEIVKGSAILVENISRFSRMGIKKTEKKLFFLWDYGIELITATDGAIYGPQAADDLRHRLTLMVQIEQANKESVVRGERVKGSYDKRKLNAKKGVVPPLRRPFWLDKNGKLNEHHKIVKKIFELHAKGFGQIRIERKLRELFPGAKPLKKVNPTKIMRILKSETCIGKIWGEKLYDAVIDESIFYTAQDIQRNRLFSSIQENRKWLLHGLVQCGHCGSGTSIQQTQGSLPLLRCSMKRRSGGERCESRSTFPYTVAHVFFVNFVEPIILTLLSDKEKNKNRKLELLKLADEKSKLLSAIEETKKLRDERRQEGKSIIMVLESLEEINEQLNAIETSVKEIAEKAKSDDDMTKVLSTVFDKSQSYDAVEYNTELLKSGYRMKLKDNVLTFSDTGDEKVLCSLEYVDYSRQDMAYRFKFKGSPKYYPVREFSGLIKSKDYSLDYLLNPRIKRKYSTPQELASLMGRIQLTGDYAPKFELDD